MRGTQPPNANRTQPVRGPKPPLVTPSGPSMAIWAVVTNNTTNNTNTNSISQPKAEPLSFAHSRPRMPRPQFLLILSFCISVILFPYFHFRIFISVFSSL
jgi:hypothetical protein